MAKEIKVVMFSSMSDFGMFTLHGFNTIENELEAFQEFVGGYIEALPLFVESDKPLYIICNEEGKIKNLPPTVKVFDGEELVDIIAGDCLLVAIDDEGNFTDVTVEDFEKAKEVLEW